MVFSEVNCKRDHAEGGLWVQRCSGIVLSTGTSYDAIYHGVGGRHGGESVTMGGAFERE